MLKGREFTAMPGHGLAAKELGFLLLHCEGALSQDIERITGMATAEQSRVERSIMAKLEARTRSHMISRAFSLGIIATRALCFVLACMSADYHDSMKNRSPIKGGRPGTVMVRIKTAGRNIWA
ncbi:hypothetical protein ACK33C_22340 [Aeromonas hydrophila]|uniref:hypothetical protein n=1 Tax=Aeromonas TaxID=642 RepID=UPI002B4790BD|nr:hypothetical protein [Aeromonas caviae]